MPLHARLYLVADAISTAHLEAAIAGGVDIVQLRLKDAPDERVLAEAARFKAVCDAHDVPLIINDRPDLACAAGAAGVHVGQDDASVTRAREILGPDAIVGLSTHTPEQVDAALALNLDYFAVGPIHATPTKPGRPAVGVELVRHAAGAVAAAGAAVPFFAIGGLEPGNLAPLLDAGAERIAVVRAITLAEDPRAAARDLRGALESRVGAA